MRRACLRTCSSCLACCPLRQVHSCPSTRYSVRKRFPAGRCGSFFTDQEEMTMAMSRQNQFVAVFYSSVERCFRGTTAVEPFTSRSCRMTGAVTDVQDILQLCRWADQQHAVTGCREGYGEVVVSSVIHWEKRSYVKTNLDY